MSLAQSLAPYLPFLRRYARALTGTQRGGDAYVVATLEAIIADPEAVTEHDDLRVGLYSVFHSIWETAQVDDTADILPDAPWKERKAQERLHMLTPRRRQALLLITLEGFTLAETSEILDAQEGEVQSLLDEATAEIERQTHARVLIIEDEAVIALDIAGIVAEMGHAVVGVAARSDEAVRLARAGNPSLILADVQLEDGNTGIQTVRRILETADLPVVFVTAFPERLLTGERLEPTFVVAKPFEPEALQVAVSQALFCAASG